MSVIWAKYAVLDNSKHVLELTPEYYWEFRPVSTADEIRVQKEIAGRTMIIGDRISGPTQMELAIIELASSFAGSNLPADSDDPDAKVVPALKDKASFQEVYDYLCTLPVALVDELWRALGEVNPTWGPKKAPKLPEKEESPEPEEGESL